MKQSLLFYQFLSLKKFELLFCKPSFHVEQLIVKSLHNSWWVSVLLVKIVSEYDENEKFQQLSRN